MQQQEQPVLRDIVLVGGGHSHVGVLRRFAMKPEPGVRLTLICNTVDTPYSGMLPGWVAGHYRHDEVHIDLWRLCAFAQARFLEDEVIGLDRAAGTVLCRGRPPVAYDLCSINIGSSPRLDGVPGADQHAVAVKPIPQFTARWLALLERACQHAGPLTIALVGGGAGGVELTLAMQHRLLRERRARLPAAPPPVFHLFSRDADVLPTHNPSVRRRFRAVLAARGVNVHLNAAVTAVDAGGVTASDGRRVAADEVVWVTQAAGPAWLRETGLALDDGGFVRVNDRLQSSDPRVFAAGDIAAFTDRPLEKAGVFAVRMGRPLADNLRRAVRGAALQPYRPQRRWLALISTGDQHAVASRGALSLAGDWVWRWKDAIDRRFMRRFSEFPADAMRPTAPRAPSTALALSADESAQALSAAAMRCGGCGAKVGATVLSRALGALAPLNHPDVLIGLHAPDDAAIVRVPPGQAAVHTVDFFRAFIDDPYRFGQIAANHALGDLHAMGAQAQSATAIATVPPGLESKVEALLFQMMSGAVGVLNAAGCALVGGHTGEGRELALGFALNGLVDADLATVMRKGGMRPGDVLLLTKPLGTGALFAAAPRAAELRWFKGRWVSQALASMAQGNATAARVLQAHHATACTDVTGFGLLGHLLEMTRPSGVDATLELEALPVLDGALECLAAGVASSLAPANLRLRHALDPSTGWATHPRHALLFDPQTAGGLLAAVPADQTDAALRALHSAGCHSARRIGHVRARSGDATPIRLSGAPPPMP